jgi:hypothetical protein
MASAFVGFLSGLPPHQIDRLYHSPWACLAVLRALPPLAKHYVMRLLYVEAGVPSVALDAWVRPGAEGKHRVALDHMRRLRVLATAATNGSDTDGGGGGGGGGGGRGGGTRGVGGKGGSNGGGGNATNAAAGGGEEVRLSPRFQRGLRLMLERSFDLGAAEDGGSTRGAGGDLGGRVPPQTTLDAYAKGRWEALLLTLTGASDAFSIAGEDTNANNGGKKSGGKGGGGGGGARKPLDVAALFCGGAVQVEFIYPIACESAWFQPCSPIARKRLVSTLEPMKRKTGFKAFAIANSTCTATPRR